MQSEIPIGIWRCAEYTHKVGTCVIPRERKRLEESTHFVSICCKLGAKRSAERPVAALAVPRTVIHYRDDASLTLDFARDDSVICDLQQGGKLKFEETPQATKSGCIFHRPLL